MWSTYTLSDGRLVDLNGLNTSLLKIHHFITECKGELLRLKLTRHIGTGKDQLRMVTGPVNIPFIGFLRNALSVATPLDGNRVGAADIGDDDRRADISRTVALNPTVLGEDESIELFAEVLNHVVLSGSPWTRRSRPIFSWKATTCSISFLMKFSYSSSVISPLPNLARALRISLVWGRPDGGSGELR